MTSFRYFSFGILWCAVLLAGCGLFHRGSEGPVPQGDGEGVWGGDYLVERLNSARENLFEFARWYGGAGEPSLFCEFSHCESGEDATVCQTLERLSATEKSECRSFFARHLSDYIDISSPQSPLRFEISQFPLLISQGDGIESEAVAATSERKFSPIRFYRGALEKMSAGALLAQLGHEVGHQVGESVSETLLDRVGAAIAYYSHRRRANGPLPLWKQSPLQGRVDATFSLPENKILLIGQDANYLVLSRLNSEGSLDSSYASAGVARVSTRESGTTELLSPTTSSFLRRDGSLIVATTCSGSTLGLCLARLSVKGDLDLPFGTTGNGLRPVHPGGEGISHFPVAWVEKNLDSFSLLAQTENQRPVVLWFFNGGVRSVRFEIPSSFSRLMGFHFEGDYSVSFFVVDETENRLKKYLVAYDFVADRFSQEVIAFPSTVLTEGFSPTTVAHLNEGGIVLGGRGPEGQWQAWQFLSDGTLDSGFGEGGIANFPPSVETPYSLEQILELPGGKLLLVGAEVATVGGSTSGCSPFLLLLRRNGAEDMRLDVGSWKGRVASSGFRASRDSWGRLLLSGGVLSKGFRHLVVHPEEVTSSIFFGLERLIF